MRIHCMVEGDTLRDPAKGFYDDAPARRPTPTDAGAHPLHLACGTRVARKHVAPILIGATSCESKLPGTAT
jgi:hypothetical protein